MNPFHRRIPVQEKINFARHLALVIKAGLPIVEGLKIIGAQKASPAFKRMVQQLIDDVNNGQFLADSLGTHRESFGDFFISIIRIGETSGTLSANLLYLVEEMQKAKELRQKIRAALIYPAVILVATIGMVGLLVFVVFPKVMPIFISLKVPLPITTRILIAASQFLVSYGWLLAAGAVAFAAAVRILFANVQGFKFFFNRLVLYIPVFSALTVNMNAANLTRVLGILLKSGVKIVEAVTVTASTVDSLVYRRALQAAAEQIRRGEQLSGSLSAHPELFPSLLSSLIEVAERTGNLEDNLAYLSEYYAKETDVIVSSLTTVLEPMLLLIMGLLVGFVAISIITPIYQITSSIHQ